jgi:hypothetical protein
MANTSRANGLRPVGILPVPLGMDRSTMYLAPPQMVLLFMLVIRSNQVVPLVLLVCP